MLRHHFRYLKYYNGPALYKIAQQPAARMRFFARLPTLPNALQGHEDSLIATDLLRRPENERKMSTFSVPEPDGNWLQELQDYSHCPMIRSQNNVSFVSSFSGRTPTVPPSIMEEEQEQDSWCCSCCWTHRHKVPP
jgi:hypothetical protein